MSKPFRMKRLGKAAKKRASKADRHLSGAMSHAAFSLADNRSARIKGTFGPASEVRRIDPSEHEDQL